MVWTAPPGRDGDGPAPGVRLLGGGDVAAHVAPPSVRGEVAAGLESPPGQAGRSAGNLDKDVIEVDHAPPRGIVPVHKVQIEAGHGLAPGNYEGRALPGPPHRCPAPEDCRLSQELGAVLVPHVGVDAVVPEEALAGPDRPGVAPERDGRAGSRPGQGERSARPPRP